MWQLTVLTILSVFLQLILTVSSVSIVKRDDETRTEIFDYNCGDILFSGEAVTEAASAGQEARLRSNKYPAPFKAPFYEKNLDLVIWPIKKDGKIFGLRSESPGIFYVVMDQSGHIKDVVVRTITSQFIKCTKFSRSSIVPDHSNSAHANGYDCSHIFFADQYLKDLAAEASKRMSNSVHLRQYKRILDDGPDFGLYLWPIPKSKNYYTKNWKTTAYFIILSLEGEVKYVKVKLMDGNFIQCPRARLPDQLSENQIEKSSEEFGYQCGFYFFGFDYLEHSVSLSKKPVVNGRKTLFPMPYRGPPFNSNIFLYPIFPGGRPYIRGSSGKHFVVFSKSNKVIGVVVKDKGTYKICEERFKNTETTMGEMGDFNCGKIDFSHDHLKNTARVASERFGRKGAMFPAKYNGPDFDIPGPYVTWPLVKDGFFFKAAGKYRLVLNPGFHIAGVLIQLNGEFKKCRRAQDKSIPGGEMMDKISESYWASRLYTS